MAPNKLKEVITRGKAMAQTLSLDKRGMGQLNHPIIWVILGLFGVVIFGGIAVIVLAAFKDSTNDTTAQTVFSNGMSLFENFFSQLGTVGTVGGVLLLLVLIGAVGLWGYGQYSNRY